MFSVFYHIAKNTFKECLREPIYLIILLVSLTLTSITPVIALFVFRAQEKMVRDTGMATMLLFGMLVAVLCASNSIHREIRSGTALLVLSKPINRPIYITAKIFGIIAVLVIFCILNGLTTLISLRVAVDQFQFDKVLFWGLLAILLISLIISAVINYLTQQNFCESSIWIIFTLISFWAVFAHFKENPENPPGLESQTALALGILSFAVLAMGTISTALSTTLNFVGNLVISSVFFLLGLMSQYLFGIAADNGNIFCYIAYALIPNWQEFWLADPISQKTIIPFSYAFDSFLYFICLTGIFFIIAVLLFQDREVGNQNIN